MESSQNQRRETELERVRRSRGLSRDRLAALAGVTPKTLYNAERERHAPNPSTARAIAEALGVDAGDLWPRITGPVAGFAAALAWSDDGTAMVAVPDGPDIEVLAGLREVQAGLAAELRFRPRLRAALMRGESVDRPEAAFVIVAWSGGEPPGFLDDVDEAVLLIGGDES